MTLRDDLYAQAAVLSASASELKTIADGLPADPPPAPPPPVVPVPQPVPNCLPGQMQWKNGANSFLFGSNDTKSWAKVNPHTSPLIRQKLQEAGIGVLRTWFMKLDPNSTHATTDADFDVRLRVPEQIGATPWGVLREWQDLEWCKHVITYCGDRCNIFEFGNEPWGADYPIGTLTWQQRVDIYNQAYTKTQAALKAINPKVVLVYGVASSATEIYPYLSRAQPQGVAIDAISFHAYGDSTVMTGQITEAKKQRDRFYPGVKLGITEWNYAGVAPAQMPSAMSNDQFMHDYVVSIERMLVTSGLDFAIHFCIANQSVWPSCDMIDTTGMTTDDQLAAIPARIRGAYYGLKDAIGEFHP